MTEPLRLLPSVSQVLERRRVRSLLRQWQRVVVRDLVREILSELRDRLAHGRSIPELSSTSRASKPAVLRIVEDRLARRLEELARPQLCKVINATGVLLHTNLGRARLSAQGAAEAARVASQSVALEVDLHSGKRGGRGARVETWLRLLTGAERAVVANNGAAALFLAVRALAKSGARVLVSRGEQVAIGGSFRMPELLRTTGAKMVDVGTTNRTALRDYARELREGDVLLKVHPSNYRVVGFTEEATLDELAGLARQRGATLIYDAGSGSLLDYGRFGLRGEETVGNCLRAGAQVVTFSGDKLLGGPQAGLVVGEATAVTRVATHPLMRAMRCDKMVLASLERSLLAYARCGGRNAPELPLFECLGVKVGELRRRGRALAENLEDHLPQGWQLSVRRSEAAVGAGAFSDAALASVELSIATGNDRSALRLHQGLRRGDPAVYTRIDDRVVACDLRSVDPGDLELLARRLREEFTKWGASLPRAKRA